MPQVLRSVSHLVDLERSVLFWPRVDTRSALVGPASVSIRLQVGHFRCCLIVGPMLSHGSLFVCPKLAQRLLRFGSTLTFVGPGWAFCRPFFGPESTFLALFGPESAHTFSLVAMAPVCACWSLPVCYSLVPSHSYKHWPGFGNRTLVQVFTSRTYKVLSHVVQHHFRLGGGCESSSAHLDPTEMTRPCAPISSMTTTECGMCSLSGVWVS